MTKNEKRCVICNKNLNISIYLRFVTKCRWVVEVINAFLKNSFKAIGEVRNNMLIHTLHDYKKAASLIKVF